LIHRNIGRIAIMAAFGAAALIGLATPALAQTKIVLTPARPSAANVSMRVSVDALQSRSGIRSVRMVLPAGITAKQATLVKGPQGWTLRPTSDGFVVSGPTLRWLTDAVFTVRLARLPANVRVLTFKTFVTYGNGHVEQWIGAAGKANAAPFVRLAVPVVASALPSPSPSASPSPSTSPAATVAAAVDRQSPSTLWLIVATIAGLLTIGLVIFMPRQRRAAALGKGATP
jgi:hypothetical protein